MPSFTSTKSRLALLASFSLLAGFSLILYPVHTFARTTLSKRVQQLDDDIHLLDKIQKRLIFRDTYEPETRYAFMMHIGAILREKDHLETSIEDGGISAGGYRFKSTVAMLRELLDGRRRSRFEEAWGEMMRAWREDWQTWERLGILRDEDEDERSLNAMLGCDINILDTFDNMGRQHEEEEDLDEGADGRDDLSWQLSQESIQRIWYCALAANPIRDMEAINNKPPSP